MTGDEVVVIARGVVAEGRSKQLLGFLARLQALTAAEPGTLSQQWYYDRTDPSVLWVHEVFQDVAALDVHRENVRELLKELARCFVELPVPNRCAPLIVGNAEFL